MSFKIILSALLLVGVARAVPWLPEARTDEYAATRQSALLNQTRDHAAEVKVVFLGDSITEGWLGGGLTTWNAHYAPRGAFAYGVGGDKTEHVLWRLNSAEFTNIQPKLVVLLIGTNNIGPNTPAEIARGIQAIVDALGVKFPGAKVLVLSILPRNDAVNDAAAHEINAIASKFSDDKRVFYLDLTSTFETKLATEKDGLFYDGLHLTAKGYDEWYRAMEPTFVKLLV